MATADDLKFQGKGDVAGADAGLGPGWGIRQALEALGAFLSVRGIKTSREFCLGVRMGSGSLNFPR